MKIRPRILYLVPDLLSLASGIGRQCRTVCSALVSSDVELSVVALLDSGTVPPGFKPFVSSFDYRVGQGSRTRFLAKALRVAIEKRPHLVITGHPYFAPAAWPLAGIARSPWISFIHGLDAWSPLSVDRRLSLRHADRIFAVSRFTACTASAINGIRMTDVRVLHNCLDPQLDSSSAPVLKEDGLSMLTVARLAAGDADKGQEYVIRALPYLVKQFPDLTYHLVGEGPRRHSLEHLVAEQKVESHVCFHGQVSEEVLRSLYRQADLYIMPSAQEGFGLAFLEAMSHGLPVIGGNVDATPEVVVHGKTGYLVNPTSVGEITEAAARLLGNSELRREMGCAAKKHVAAHFDFPSFRMKLLGYLAELRPDLF